MEGLARYDLLRHILPECAALMAGNPTFAASLREALGELDAHASDPARESALSVLLAHYLKAFLECGPDRIVDTPDAYREAVHESRLFLAPLNPPRVELEAAVLVVFKRRGHLADAEAAEMGFRKGRFRAADAPRKEWRPSRRALAPDGEAGRGRGPRRAPGASGRQGEAPISRQDGAGDYRGRVRPRSGGGRSQRN